MSALLIFSCCLKYLQQKRISKLKPKAERSGARNHIYLADLIFQLDLKMVLIVSMMWWEVWVTVNAVSLMMILPFTEYKLKLCISENLCNIIHKGINRISSSCSLQEITLSLREPWFRLLQENWKFKKKALKVFYLCVCVFSRRLSHLVYTSCVQSGHVV